jgi:hypothetical protein
MSRYPTDTICFQKSITFVSKKIQKQNEHNLHTIPALGMKVKKMHSTTFAMPVCPYVITQE